MLISNGKRNKALCSEKIPKGGTTATRYKEFLAISKRWLDENKCHQNAVTITVRCSWQSAAISDSQRGFLKLQKYYKITFMLF